MSRQEIEALTRGRFSLDLESEEKTTVAASDNGVSGRAFRRYTYYIENEEGLQVLEAEPLEEYSQASPAVLPADVLAEQAETLRKQLGDHTQVTLTSRAYGHGFRDQDNAPRADRFHSLVCSVARDEWEFTKTYRDLAQIRPEDFQEDLAEAAWLDSLPETGRPDGPTGPLLFSGQAMTMFFLTAWKMFTDNDTFPEAVSPLVTLWDKASLDGAGYPTGMDSRGTVHGDTLLTLQGVRKGQIRHTGRTPGIVRGYRPCIIPRNFLMEAGTTPEKILRESLQNGLYVYDAFDPFHALDPASGTYHFPAAAVLYRGGKTVGKVSQITLEGNFKDLLKNVKAVGDRLHEQPLIISDTYLTAAPMILTGE